MTIRFATILSFIPRVRARVYFVPAKIFGVLGSIFLNIGAFFNISGTITILIFDPLKYAFSIDCCFPSFPVNETELN